jgi:acetyltransferase-like isoleucine patch superfamily enzyme
VPTPAGVLSRTKTAYYKLRYRRFATFGSMVRVKGRLKFSGPGKIVIGDRVYFDDAMGQANRIRTTDPNAIVTIGDGCYVNGVEVIANDRVEIGEKCMIADSLIMTSDFHSTRRSRWDDDAHPRSGPVTIGRNVWLAARTSVLQGVTVGDDSVVALGTVVATDVPSGYIVASQQQRLVRPVND